MCLCLCTDSCSLQAVRRHRAIHHVLSTVTNIVSEHNSRGGQVANRLSPTLTTIDLAFAGVTRRGRLCVALENLVCAQANDRPRKNRLAEVAKAVASLAYQRLAPLFMLENGPAKEATNEIFPECWFFSSSWSVRLPIQNTAMRGSLAGAINSRSCLVAPLTAIPCSIS